MAEELRSCPFCGGKPILGPFDGAFIGVLCRDVDCPASMANGYRGKDAAIDAWNRRPAAAEEAAVKLLADLVEGGPYTDGEGGCSFCSFTENDSEDLDHVKAHGEKCEWRRGKEFLALAASREGRG